MDGLVNLSQRLPPLLAHYASAGCQLPSACWGNNTISAVWWRHWFIYHNLCCFHEESDLSERGILRWSFVFFGVLPGTFGIHHIPLTSISHLLSCNIHMGWIQSELVLKCVILSAVPWSRTAFSEENMSCFIEQKSKVNLENYILQTTPG